MEKRSIQMDPKDNVATVLSDVDTGDAVQVFDENQNLLVEIKACQPIPMGNKLALADLDAGDFMVRYGERVGKVCKPIRKGQLVHVHNVRSINPDIPESIIQEIIQVMNITE